MRDHCELHAAAMRPSQVIFHHTGWLQPQDPQAPAQLQSKRSKGTDLANVAQLIPGLAGPVLASGVDPVLYLSKACFDVLTIAEAAALPPQQQLVEQLHVDEAEDLHARRDVRCTEQ